MWRAAWPSPWSWRSSASEVSMGKEYSREVQENDDTNGEHAQPARVFADLGRIAQSSAVTALKQLAIAVFGHPARTGEVAVIDFSGTLRLLVRIDAEQDLADFL